MAALPAPEAIVIGTGFGGSVVACRLAQAGVRTTVLERGRRYPTGSFPRDASRLDGWLWGHDRGLFDIRPANDVFVVQAAGYGGGSLIYANVHFRPPADVFKPGTWLHDEGFSRSGLDPYYDLAAYMLDVAPIDNKQPNGIPPKTVLVEEAARRLGRTRQTFRPNLAVNFGPVGAAAANKFGALQSGCTHCGECDIGCNIHAKNTLDLNYLAVAEQFGAQVLCGLDVQKICKDGDGYRVSYTDEHGEKNTLSAPHVFVCCGALNSTELLLRSSDSLNVISSRLGHSYSANGDLLGFAFDTAKNKAYFPGKGPTITTATVFDNASTTNRVWFAFEDGGYPRELIDVLQLLNPPGGADSGELSFRDRLDSVVGREAANTSQTLIENADHSAVFLCMGRDHADGVIDLIPGGDRAHIHWNIDPDLPLYTTEQGLAHDFADQLGGQWVDNPAWRFLRQPVSVHNLGGCPMGATIADGVVGPDGGVFNNPGLYVIDGSIIPSATGANPSATIAAVAEMCIERAIRSITGNSTWVAPERPVQPPQLPEDGVKIPPQGTAPPLTPTVGMRFDETMKGGLTFNAAGASALAIGRAGSEIKASFALTISTPSMADLLNDPLHPASADGTVRLNGITADAGAPVMGGRFNLFIPTESFYQRQMIYQLPFRDHRTGRQLILSGHKDIWDHGRFDVWPSTTTLHVELVDASPERLGVLAEGSLRLNLLMLAHQLTTVRATGTPSAFRQVAALAEFGVFFVGNLGHVFLRSKFDA